jgi:thiol-disulfide isomerase/thioredoxin
MGKAVKMILIIVIALALLFVTFFAGVFTMGTLHQRHEQRNVYPPQAAAMLRLAERLREGKTQEALATADFWAANFLCHTGVFVTGEDMSKAPPEILAVLQEAKKYYERYDVNEPGHRSPIGYVKNHLAHVPWPPMKLAKEEFKARYGGGKLEKAPRFEIEHWFSKPVSGEDMEGKVILLDFWNVGCGPCEISLPKLQAMYEEYGPKGLVVIGLAGGPKKVTAEFLKKHGYTFPVGRETDKTFLNYAIEGVPTFFMIDKQGRLAWGPKHELPDANEIERLLGDQHKAK